MEIHVSATSDEMAKAAARRAASTLRRAIETQGHARFIAATGNSQLEFLSYLVKEPGIDWKKTTMFHLDEYLGVSEEHPASFVGYLKRRLTDLVPVGEVYYLFGDAPDYDAQLTTVSDAIAVAPIDVAFVGIGENGHLAFNDPPADFETERPYIIVDLDEACRMQQVNEGWFPDIASVPTRALSMSIRQIMKSREIVCTVPDARKAIAVRECIGADSPVSPEHPASILQTHPGCHVFLDTASAALL
ncbi:MAG: glucosamine-6-phosphate deaminase [Alkalispirochaeta sp.]